MTTLTMNASRSFAKKPVLLCLPTTTDLIALVSATSKARNGLQRTLPAMTRNADGALNLGLIQSQMDDYDIAFEDGTG